MTVFTGTWKGAEKKGSAQHTNTMYLEHRKTANNDNDNNYLLLKPESLDNAILKLWLA